MFKILKYSFFDLMRSRWSYVYFAFYLILGFVLLFLNNDVSKGIITLMNVIIVLIPLIATLFGIMYYYDSREFTQLLLAQPMTRTKIFLGQYFGLSLSLVLSLVLGLGIPFAFYGLFNGDFLGQFLLLMLAGIFLTFIFSALSFWIGLKNENRIKGFGYALLLWLFMAIIYDGIFLLFLIIFQEYPLEKLTLIMTLLNPIDLSRILILLQLDISALLGYTGAIFKQFFGTHTGFIVAFSILSLWMIIPILGIVKTAKKKDF